MAFSGTQHFVFQDVNGRQTVHVNYQNVKGVGVQTGTQYTVHENDHYTTVLNQNGDTTLTQIIHGTFMSSGSGDNTLVEVKIVTVLYPNGDVDTIVDDVDVKCPG